MLLAYSLMNDHHGENRRLLRGHICEVNLNDRMVYANQNPYYEKEPGMLSLHLPYLRSVIQGRAHSLMLTLTIVWAASSWNESSGGGLTRMLISFHTSFAISSAAITIPTL